MSFWTGVGSRKTPAVICELMTLFAATKRGTMRSGAAEKADEYFEAGAVNTEIYLPWPNFMGHKTGIHDYSRAQIKFAEKIAQEVYPVVIRNQTHMKLFRRNVFQVVGLADSKKNITPSSFLLCWTPDQCTNAATYKFGTTGGTGIAIMVAEKFGVPVFNMSIPDHLEMVLERLDEYGVKTKPYRKRLIQP